MLADGIQSPVTHFRVISPPAITAVGVEVNITDGTSTVQIKTFNSKPNGTYF